MDNGGGHLGGRGAGTDRERSAFANLCAISDGGMERDDADGGIIGGSLGGSSSRGAEPGCGASAARRVAAECSPGAPDVVSARLWEDLRQLCVYRAGNGVGG